MQPSEPGLMHLIVEQSPDALLVVDDSGVIVFANAAVTTLFGFPSAAIVGQSIEALVPERSRGVHQRLRSGYSAAPETREMGARLVALSGRRSDGTEFPAEIRLAPIQNGGRHFVLAAVRDVTDRRRISDALGAARAEADSANKAKSRFLATASHDLRQPLQSLQLLTAALARRMTEPALAELVGRQQTAIVSMGDLLNSLLDITRLESGALQPTFSAVSLAGVLADLEQQFETLAAARGLTLDFAVTDVWLRTDRVLLRQLLQNLLNNALKFTAAGGVSLSVERAATGLRIAVVDTGIGIAAADIARIFDEYYRVDSPGIETRGFGLGLTIVRQIARLLGFTVTVQSAPGAGATFTLEAPAAALIKGDAAGPAALAPLYSGISAVKPGLLIVEDDAPVREALALMLSSEGYPVRSVESAGAAEALFAESGGEFDVVVSDYHLGSDETGRARNGAELIDVLRRLAGRDLPVVILSGDTTSALESVKSLPRATLLRKPADAAQLIAAIEQLFGG